MGIVRLVVALALGQVAGVAWGQELRIQFEDGRPVQRLPLERLEPGSQEWYVGANLLCRALDVERFWKPETGKLVLKIEGERVQTTVDTRLVLQGDDEVLLHVPVRYRRGSVMLPLDLIERVLGPMAGMQLDRGSLTLQIGRGRNDIEALEFVQLGEDTQMSVRLSRRIRYRVETTASEIVRLRLYGAEIAPVTLARDAPTRHVRNVRAEQLEDEAVIYIELAQRLDDADAHDEDDGRTIVVTLRPRLASAPPPEFKLPGGESPVASGERSCRRIMLDAGHGGYDTGVRAAGLMEKDVTLELVRRIESVLERRFDLEVELLRQGDRAYTADRRAELANKSNADVVISLHCNAWFDETAQGFEVLFVGPGQQGVQSARQAGPDFRPWRTAQQPYAARSQTLAQHLQSEMGRVLPVENRGAREADIEFLRGLSMPAVLIEVGFLTNPREAALIGDPTFPERMAEAIGTAMRRYCEESDSSSARHDEPGRIETGARN
jgi:N-acetylmuramoyl-L-alanine amidase